MTTTQLRPAHAKEAVERDLVTGETVFTTDEDDGAVRIDHIGLEVEHRKTECFRIRDDDPLSARVDIGQTHAVGRGGWRVRTVTQTTMTATAEEVVVHASLDAFEGDKRILSRNWDVRHRRDLV
jgi:hypothetical protein